MLWISWLGDGFVRTLFAMWCFLGSVSLEWVVSFSLTYHILCFTPACDQHDAPCPALWVCHINSMVGAMHLSTRLTSVLLQIEHLLSALVVIWLKSRLATMKFHHWEPNYLQWCCPLTHCLVIASCIFALCFSLFAVFACFFVLLAFLSCSVLAGLWL